MDKRAIPILIVQRTDGFDSPKKRTKVLYTNQWPKRRMDWTMPTRSTKRIRSKHYNGSTSDSPFLRFVPHVLAHPLGKYFSHKGKRSGKNGKWIHTSRGGSCQGRTIAVKSRQDKETAWSLLNKKCPIQLLVGRSNDGEEQELSLCGHLENGP
jgi:hypothetical protein